MNTSKGKARCQLTLGAALGLLLYNKGSARFGLHLKPALQDCPGSPGEGLASGSALLCEQLFAETWKELT